MRRTVYIPSAIVGVRLFALKDAHSFEPLNMMFPLCIMQKKLTEFECTPHYYLHAGMHSTMDGCRVLLVVSLCSLDRQHSYKDKVV
jgi:hypothetical protein